MALAHIQLKNSPQLSVVFASEFYSETSWISVSYRSRPKIELERGLLFVSWRLNATRAALHATLSPRTSRLLSTGSSKFRFRFVFVAGHLLGSPRLSYGYLIIVQVLLLISSSGQSTDHLFSNTAAFKDGVLDCIGCGITRLPCQTLERGELTLNPLPPVILLHVDISIDDPQDSIASINLPTFRGPLITTARRPRCSEPSVSFTLTLNARSQPHLCLLYKSRSGRTNRKWTLFVIPQNQDHQVYLPCHRRARPNTRIRTTRSCIIPIWKTRFRLAWRTRRRSRRSRMEKRRCTS